MMRLNKWAKEWEDVSYGNDTCPSFEFKGHQIFIDNENPTEREIQDGKRFHIINAGNHSFAYLFGFPMRSVFSITQKLFSGEIASCGALCVHYRGLMIAYVYK